MNISLNIVPTFTKFSTFIENILMQGTVSQNFYLGLSFNFMTKKRVTFVIFCYFQNYQFSTCHKTKTRAYIKTLRHGVLLMGLNDIYSKSQA